MHYVIEVLAKIEVQACVCVSLFFCTYGAPRDFTIFQQKEMISFLAAV